LLSAKIAPATGGRQAPRTEQGGRLVSANIMRAHGVDVPVLLHFVENEKPRSCVLEASTEGYGTALVAELTTRDPDEGRGIAEKSCRSMQRTDRLTTRRWCWA
jgi:hypothetical protein